MEVCLRNSSDDDESLVLVAMVKRKRCYYSCYH